MRRLVALLVSIAVPALASAHHSFSEFDQSRTIQISGTLTDYAWQNPHVKLKVEAELDGKTVTWDIECHSIGVLSRVAERRPRSRRRKACSKSGALRAQTRAEVPPGSGWDCRRRR
jgi:uncharacterized protein DUF6152